MPAKHVCITGKDGAGKSTLIKKLADHYAPCYIANIWDLLENPVDGIPFNSKMDIDNFLCGLTPDSRLLFLAHAMKYSIDKAFESNKGIIITDSYYFKYFASERALGADLDLIGALVNSFPLPDITVEIDIPLEISARRKVNFSRYECGLTLSASIENFIAFQKEVAKAWDIFDHIKMHKIKGMEKEDDTFKEVLKIIEHES